MNSSIQTIPLLNLLVAFIPVSLVLGIVYYWRLNTQHTVIAIGRMLLQLLLIGYVLSYIFESDSSVIIAVVLTVMVFSSSWIALGNTKAHRRRLFRYALCAIFVGGGLTLLCITQGVLQLSPWYSPRYIVPLAGMIFASSMNSVSLASERLQAEMSRGIAYPEAKNIAFQASLIPVVNSLLAVGLVSIPGMMTGQILSGISPLIAAQYQMMVMCMVFGASGISSALFLMMIKDVRFQE